MHAALRLFDDVTYARRGATALLTIYLGLAWLAAPAVGQTGPTAGPRRESQPPKTAQRQPAGPIEPAQRDFPRRDAAAVPTVPAIPQRPFAPLTPEHQKYLDDILKYWEQSSTGIDRYSCKFQRWHYDPVFGPKEHAKTYSTGVIKYAAPDKGMFKVEKIRYYTPPKVEGESPKYVELKEEVEKSDLEHWICDGQAVFQHDYPNKTLVEVQLPPDMRGKAIVDGPLPFLFGAKAEKIKERYWVRVVTPDDAKGEYWLEAFPKTLADAANLKKIEIIIDEKDFLPKAMQVYPTEYDARKNTTRDVFVFSDRTKNELIIDPLRIWIKDFYRPALPKGWKKIVKNYEPDEPAPSVAPPKGNQAKAPGGKQPLK